MRLRRTTPSFYERFAADFHLTLGFSIASAVSVVFMLNLMFNHWSWRRPGAVGAIDEALGHGAAAADVPDRRMPLRGEESRPAG